MFHCNSAHNLTDLSVEGSCIFLSVPAIIVWTESRRVSCFMKMNQMLFELTVVLHMLCFRAGIQFWVLIHHCSTRSGIQGGGIWRTYILLTLSRLLFFFQALIFPQTLTERPVRKREASPGFLWFSNICWCFHWILAFLFCVIYLSLENICKHQHVIVNVEFWKKSMCINWISWSFNSVIPNQTWFCS